MKHKLWLLSAADSSACVPPEGSLSSGADLLLLISNDLRQFRCVRQPPGGKVLEMSNALRTGDFEIEIPTELIARQPCPMRDQSRLLVVHRDSERLEHRQFPDLLEYLRLGDVLVLNDSRVIPARLHGRNLKTGGHFEILLLEEKEPNVWEAMMRPGRRAQVGTRIGLQNLQKKATGITAFVEQVSEAGHRRLRFSGVENLFAELDKLGEVPLPPYLDRPVPEPLDRERYQTVYAHAPGSVAAPTAGLHFTEAMLGRIRERGVQTCFVTLHVGAGTFAPVKTEIVSEHRMHRERFEISPETARLVVESKAAGRRIIAVGTTTLRVLESAAAAGPLVSGSGVTDIFIYPPFNFKMVDALVTNFHLTRSTLLMLVCAFAAPGQTSGRDLVFRAYREAIAQRYRFFSYGDAMFLV